MTKPRSFVSKLILKPFKSFVGKGERNEDDLEKIAAKEHKPFAYKTLASATRDFHPDHKLGEGGFGPVYKGKLEDGKEIAVKKLSLSSKQGNKEFMNEARLLARVQHRNVVNLLGHCVHGTEKLLVYEYLPRQSLDKFLFDSQRREELGWKKRYDIIVGVARGLLYLHEDSHVSIIHRDIKASNILLDEKWIPKIADFGMARLFPEEQTHINTRVAGTNGYMAPEYVMHGRLSIKADVYSFGVVVLELICGQKNSTFNMDNDKDAKNLLEWAWKLYKNGRSLEMIDVTISSGEATEQIVPCIKIGLLCVQADPKLRPTMRNIVLMLLKKSNIIEEPTVPGYPGHRYRKPRRHAGSSSSGESSVRPTASTSGTYSSGESSQNLDSTFNSGMSSTSTMTRPGRRSHDRHGTSSTHTMKTTPSHSQEIRSSSSTSGVTDPRADRSAGKRPMKE